MSYASFSSLWKILLLCLVSVTTEACSPGKWGENCSSVCGHCKDGVDCNSKTGECPADCAPGYKTTLRCENECPDGYYGQACLLKCIEECKKCNKVNGSCKLFCKSDLQGYNCIEAVEVQAKSASSKTLPITNKYAAVVWPTALVVTCLLSVLLTVLVGFCVKVQRRRSHSTIPRPNATGTSQVTDTSLEQQTLADKNQGLTDKPKAYLGGTLHVYEQLSGD